MYNQLNTEVNMKENKILLKLVKNDIFLNYFIKYKNKI